jgi:hypothetical protein
VLILAASKDQAKRVHDYALAFLTASPVLRKLVLEVTVGEIRLTNGVIIAHSQQQLPDGARAHLARLCFRRGGVLARRGKHSA